MCGIVAYSGSNTALPYLLEGLKKLEYRGYDSAGLTIVEDTLITVKEKGRLALLEKELKNYSLNGTCGIGHTRWATHGIPSKMNSHPHNNKEQTLSIVHNGIIENYKELKDELMNLGYVFSSQTDSEVIVHLLDYYYQGDFLKATQQMIKRLKGSYALCIVSSLHQGEIIVTRKDSPLIIARLDGAYMAASDIPAILDYSKDVCFLDDGDIAILSKNNISFYNCHLEKIEKEFHQIPYDNETAKKNGYSSFMEKEIYEQPQVVLETIRGRFQDQTILFPELDEIDFSKFNRIYLVACGTAYHACLYGAKLLEKLIHIPVITMVASEFRYSDMKINEKTLALFVSQSGETADTLSSLRLAKSAHATALSITNVLGSSMSRESNYVLYTCAKIEIAVASTKAYTTQLILLALLDYYIAQRLNISFDQDIIQQIKKIPSYMEDVLKDAKLFEEYSLLFKDKQDAYYLGRGIDYISALEGALKLKEVSYVHADAYLAGELKHGPIALIEQDSLVVSLISDKTIADKTLSNIQETISRGAQALLFTTCDITKDIKYIYKLPSIDCSLSPLLMILPLQLLSFYVAKVKGCDIDKPRNLAKSVTVE